MRRCGAGVRRRSSRGQADAPRRTRAHRRHRGGYAVQRTAKSDVAVEPGEWDQSHRDGDGYFSLLLTIGMVMLAGTATGASSAECMTTCARADDAISRRAWGRQVQAALRGPGKGSVVYRSRRSAVPSAVAEGQQAEQAAARPSAQRWRTAPDLIAI